MVNFPRKEYGPLTIIDGNDIMLSGRYPADFTIKDGTDLKFIVSLIDLIIDGNIDKLPKEVQLLINETANYLRERRSKILRASKYRRKRSSKIKKESKPKKVKAEKKI